MSVVVKLKGGPGSGFHGHAGRPGEVGGSTSEGTAISMKPSEGYIEQTSKRMREYADAYTMRHGPIGGPPEVDGAMALGYRMMRGAGGDVEATYAMFEYIEKKVGFETALKVAGTAEGWTMSPSSCEEEWIAAKKIAEEMGDNHELPKSITGDLPTLTDAEIEGYKARLEFVQAYFKEKYPDGIDLYRGVKGVYAGKLKKIYQKALWESTSPDEKHPIKIPVNSLTSYSLNSWDTRYFAGGGQSRSGRYKPIKGMIFKKHVTYKDVWSLPRVLGATSPITFMEDEGEIVVYNPGGYDIVEVDEYA